MTIRIRDKITMMRDVVNIYGESGPDLKKISNANVIMKANAIRGSGMCLKIFVVGKKITPRERIPRTNNIGIYTFRLLSSGWRVRYNKVYSIELKK